jgi:hypothetical protein
MAPLIHDFLDRKVAVAPPSKTRHETDDRSKQR